MFFNVKKEVKVRNNILVFEKFLWCVDWRRGESSVWAKRRHERADHRRHGRGGVIEDVLVCPEDVSSNVSLLRIHGNGLT